MRGLFDSGHKVLAAFLWGTRMLSDLLAILLLMLPINVGTPLAPQTVGAGFGMRRRDTLDGDYRRID